MIKYQISNLVIILLQLSYLILWSILIYLKMNYVIVKSCARIIYQFGTVNLSIFCYLSMKIIIFSTYFGNKPKC